MSRLISVYIICIIFYSKAQASITVETVNAKLDAIVTKLHQVDILGYALQITHVDKNLRDLNDKIESLNQKIIQLENKFQSSPIFAAANKDLSSVSTGFEQKMEEYNKKIIINQQSMEKDVKKQLQISESLPPLFQQGITKILSKLETASTEWQPIVEASFQSLEEKFDLQTATLENSEASNKETQIKIEDFISKQLEDWTLVHKQLRDITVKLRTILTENEFERIMADGRSGASKHDGNNDDLKPNEISLRIKKNINDLQSIVLPTLDHLNDLRLDPKNVTGQIPSTDIRNARDNFATTVQKLIEDFQSLNEMVDVTSKRDEHLNASLAKIESKVFDYSDTFLNASETTVTTISQNLANYHENLTLFLEQITEKLQTCFGQGENNPWWEDRNSRRDYRPTHSRSRSNGPYNRGHEVIRTRTGAMTSDSGMIFTSTTHKPLINIWQDLFKKG